LRIGMSTWAARKGPTQKTSCTLKLSAMGPIMQDARNQPTMVHIHT